VPGSRQSSERDHRTPSGDTGADPIPLDQLAAFASHELRTPINTLQAFLTVLLSEQPGSLNEVQKDFVYSMLSASKRLERLAEDIAVLSSGDRGFSNDPQKVDVLALLQECEHEISATTASLAVTTEVHAVGPGDWHIQIDPIRFSQIAINLLENAVRNSTEGTTVQAKLRLSPSRLLLVIENNATDEVSDVDIARWLKPYERGPESDRRHPSGSGLGLAVVAHLAAVLGGRVYARAKGTRVTLAVLLPRLESFEVSFK
jgi:signal transduction histidine kinase